MTESVIRGLVSTIIPVYNRPKLIHKAVESVLAQSYRPIEIILVNDGSIDNTGAVLDSLAQHHSQEIQVIHKENEGPGLSREAGRLAARGEFIQYLDSDDWLLPNKFNDQVMALRANPDCDIAYGTAMFVDNDEQVINANSRWTGKQFDYLFPALLERRWWYTHTPLFTRRISDAAGPWPRRRPEDWDLEARMGAMRAKLVHCGSTVSCQREHASSDRVSHQAMSDYLIDEAWFLPRLFDCAVRAGVQPGSGEMKRFSRWVFMRARDLGAIDEPELANQLLQLAAKAAERMDWSLRTVQGLANTLGWLVTSRLCSMAQRLRNAKG